MSLKKFIPSPLKLRAKIIQRSIKDLKNSPNFALTKANMEIKDSLTLSQPIYYNTLSHNKVENLKISSAKISPIVIAPNEVFSFWKLIMLVCSQLTICQKSNCTRF